MMPQTQNLIEVTSIASNRCKFFHAGDNPEFFYPYRLQSPGGKVNHRRRSKCFEYILDSGILQDEQSKGNEFILDKAHEVNANYVVPKDYIGDIERTEESVREFMELYEEHECAATPIIPLQPPHGVHYERTIDHSHYALGGVKDKSPEEQIDYAKEVRAIIGDDKYLHGFGIGPTEHFFRAVRKDPNLFDSVDSSTVETDMLFDKIQDESRTTREFQMPNGQRTNMVYGSFIQSGLFLINYMMTPLCDWGEFEELTSSAMEW